MNTLEATRSTALEERVGFSDELTVASHVGLMAVAEAQTQDEGQHRQAEIFGEAMIFAHDALTDAGMKSVLFDSETVKDRAENIAAGQTKIRTEVSNLLEYATRDKITLRKDFSGSEDSLRQGRGPIDEDSFDFTWQLLDHLAKLDQAIPAIEKKAEQMLGSLRSFYEEKDGFDRIAKDFRLQGLRSLSDAVEFAQIRDFEAARSELEKIPETGMRNLLTRLLGEAEAVGPRQISPEESAENLVSSAQRLSVAEIPQANEDDTTRIVSNRSLDTFIEMFSPFSNGRIYPAVEGIKQKTSAPSSGDGWGRQQTEPVLGHDRHLFTPRVVYGSLVGAEHLGDRSDLAWEYGNARFILKEDSFPAKHASFCIGDSLNREGWGADRDLLRSRVVLRHDAVRADKMLRQKFGQSTRNTGRGSIEHYVEAQFPGLHISNVEAVILRRPQSGGSEKLMDAAENAALSGIGVTYIFEWDKEPFFKNQPDIATTISKTQAWIDKTKSKMPDVKLVLEVGDEADFNLLQAIDKDAAQVLMVG